MYLGHWRTLPPSLLHPLTLPRLRRRRRCSPRRLVPRHGRRPSWPQRGAGGKAGSRRGASESSWPSSAATRASTRRTKRAGWSPCRSRVVGGGATHRGEREGALKGVLAREHRGTDEKSAKDVVEHSLVTTGSPANSYSIKEGTPRRPFRGGQRQRACFCCAFFGCRSPGWRHVERAWRRQVATRPKHRRGSRDDGRGRVPRGRHGGTATVQQRRPASASARGKPRSHASRYHVAERLNPRRVSGRHGVGQQGQQLRGVRMYHLAARADHAPPAVRDCRSDCGRWGEKRHKSEGGDAECGCRFYV